MEASVQTVMPNVGVSCARENRKADKPVRGLVQPLIERCQKREC